MLTTKNNDLIYKWHAPTCFVEPLFSPKHLAHKNPSRSATMLCDYKFLISATTNTYSTDSFVTQLLVTEAKVAMTTSLIVWIPRHCNLPGIQLDDAQAMLGAAESHADKGVDSAALVAHTQ